MAYSTHGGICIYILGMTAQEVVKRKTEIKTNDISDKGKRG